MANFEIQTTSDTAHVLEHMIIKHCAPTLCGIKPGCLFLIPRKCLENSPCCTGNSQVNLGMALSRCRKKVADAGVCITLLAQRAVGYVVYVYRPRQLQRAFADPAIARFLQQEGYDPTNVEASLAHLRRRMKQASMAELCQRRCAFPHELGVFLGYPLEDVVGFIENQGENYLFCGCWKVYANERDARACFCRYKECAKVLKKRFERGEGMEKLTVVEKEQAC